MVWQARFSEVQHGLARSELARSSGLVVERLGSTRSGEDWWIVVRCGRRGLVGRGNVGWEGRGRAVLVKHRLADRGQLRFVLAVLAIRREVRRGRVGPRAAGRGWSGEVSRLGQARVGRVRPYPGLVR